MPTPDTLVTQMLQAAQTMTDDLVFDLGSGDSNIPIAAKHERLRRSTSCGSCLPELRAPPESPRKALPRSCVNLYFATVSGEMVPAP